MLAAGMTLTVCGVALGFGDLVRIGALALLLPLISLLATNRERADLQVRRSPHPPLLAAGQPASVQVTLRNRGNRSTPVLLAEEHVGLGLGEGTRVVVPSLRPGQSWEFGYPIRPLRRGRHQLGPLDLHRRDVFGLSASSVRVLDVAEVVALPVVHRLIGSSVTIGTGIEGTNPTLVALHGEDDASLRGYQQGDDLRRIHWPVTAHRGELMVRHEGQPTLLRALIVIGGYAAPPLPAGSSRSLPAGPGGTAGPGATAVPAAVQMLDWMVEALASVTVHLAGGGYALHVLTPLTLGASTAAVRLTPAQALRALAVVDPDAPEYAGPPASLIAAARDLTGQGGVVVTAISDHDKATAHQVLSIKGGTTPGMLFILDSASFGAWPEPSPASPRGRADRLAGLARSGGWRVAVVRRGDSMAGLWAAMNAEGRIGVAR